MARFFIERPIFAWVVAIFIIVAGIVSITQLPIAQYPQVAPPTITVSATYPGATARTLEDSVLAVIEREMNGATGLAYVETKSEANGTGSITLTFDANVNPNMAQVDVQNRLSRATPRLPAAVTQQGVRVEQSSSSFLMMVSVSSTDGSFSIAELNDYVARNILPELQRVSGVGSIMQFGAERAMRIWIDPVRLKGFDLSIGEVNSAIATQNAQVPAGTIGDMPLVKGQTISATVTLPGQLTSVEEFGNIILRANTDGSTVRLRDVARIEIGQQGYNANSRKNGKDAVGIAIQLTSTANALATAQGVIDKMNELERYFPPGIGYDIPFDTSTFISASIEKVIHSLIEAIALVFLVMLLFLQKIRYTIIPTIVVPIALLGTFAVLLALGFSINVLTMFAMVLVIGIVVDDAIIVVENVERIMAEEGLPPLQATRKAMGQISGAIVGVTAVLISVFVPLAFFPGSTGNIYRQFSVTMAVAIAFSAFLALSLTPALCATLLQPVEKGRHTQNRFFAWFNRSFASVARSYERGLARMLRRMLILVVVFAGLAAAAVFMIRGIPSGFLPDEDQGVMMALVQLPSGASRERTQQALSRVEEFVMQQPEVANIITVNGFSFSGRASNQGMAFIMLRNWNERKKAEQAASALIKRANEALARDVNDAFIAVFNPPSIPGMGVSQGFSFRLQDRSSKGHEALLQARGQLLGLAASSPIITGTRPDGLEDAPQLRINIDREKATAMGVSFSAINTTLSTAMGSAYINDFPNQGRMQRVVVQADASARMQPEQLLALTVPNNRGQLIPLSTFASSEWMVGPMQTRRYNNYPAMALAGEARPGYSSGAAMDEMEALAAQLPDGFGYEWTALSREEKIAGSQEILLYGFAILAVFLALAALYESWSIPFAVILVVPLGAFGVVAATLLRGLPNDIYFRIGLITIIGLSAKNAILIIEFAKDLQAQGKSVVAAALDAAHLRFRPILMTSLAFTMGVLPLYFATGASSASQRAIGTGVTGGMITGTVFALLLVPAFFVVIRSFFKGSARQHAHDERQARKLQEIKVDED